MSDTSIQRLRALEDLLRRAQTLIVEHHAAGVSRTVPGEVCPCYLARDPQILHDIDVALNASEASAPVRATFGSNRMNKTAWCFFIAWLIFLYTITVFTAGRDYEINFLLSRLGWKVVAQ